MKYIWIGRRPIADDVQMNIFIFDSTLVEAAPIDRMCGHLLNKDAKKLNEFLDKYADAQPFDRILCYKDTGELTERFIKETREAKEKQPCRQS